jgi:hypothetical protein
MLLVIIGSVLLAVRPATAQPAAGGACDRACLEAFVDRFLDAYITHDPAALPLTRNVKYTENGQRLELGDGTWRSLVGKGAYRLFVSDPQAGQVAFIGTLREENNNNLAGVPILIALRLRIEDRQISEIESFIVRSERAAQSVETLGKPHPLFLETVPAAERMSRDDLVKTANMYFTGMQMNDGKGEYPFTDDCDRFENGMRATNVPTPPGQTRPDPKTATSYPPSGAARSSSSRACSTSCRAFATGASSPSTRNGGSCSASSSSTTWPEIPGISRCREIARSPPVLLSPGPGRLPNSFASNRAKSAVSRPSWSVRLTEWALVGARGKTRCQTARAHPKQFSSLADLQSFGSGSKLRSGRPFST